MAKPATQKRPEDVTTGDLDQTDTGQVDDDYQVVEDDGGDLPEVEAAPAAKEADKPKADKGEKKATVHDARNAIYARAPKEPVDATDTPIDATAAPIVATDDTVDADDNAGKTEVTIDGQKRFVSQEELVAGFQKDAAADNRLRDAGELRSQLRAMIAEQQSQTQQPAADSQTSDDGQNVDDDTQQGDGSQQTSGDPISDDRLTKVVDALQLGDTDEAKQELGDLIRDLQTQPTEGPDTMQIAAAVQQNITREQEHARLRETYPEFFDSQRVQALTQVEMAGQAIAEMEACGVEKQYLDAARANPSAAIEFHRDLFDQQSAGRGAWNLTKPADIFESTVAVVIDDEAGRTGDSSPANERRASRQAEKRNLAPQPRRASQASATRSSVPKPQTPSAAVEQMKRARGLLVS